MKKIIISILAVLVIAVGGFAIWVKMSYEGKDYYVKITMDAKQVQEKTKEGHMSNDYMYNLPAYDKEGQEKQVEFNGMKNLKRGSYLDVTYNDGKGVIKWSEVKEKDVPKAALDKLNS